MTDSYRDSARRIVRASVLGFGPATDETIEVRPQDIFKGTRLIIPSLLGWLYAVRDLQIDGRSQFVRDGDIPAIVFSEAGIGTSLALDPCCAGRPIVLKIKRLHTRLPIAIRLKGFFVHFIYGVFHGGGWRTVRKSFSWLLPRFYPPFTAALMGVTEEGTP